MNGHSDGYDYAPMQSDDDDGPVQTDIECPFCGHYVEWRPRCCTATIAKSAGITPLR
jgi:hypothetical protein